MTTGRLKALLLVFFIALALPTSILVYQAYGQLKWETFHQHQLLARELSLRIDARFEELIEREENRPFSDYQFLNVSAGQESAFLQRSPLSQYPPDSEVSGLLGYFQVDSQGQLQTPVVPGSNASDYGIDNNELKQRIDQENNLRDILGRNRLVEKQDSAPAIAASEPLLEQEILQSLSSSAVFSVEEDRQGISAFDSLNSPSKKARAESKLEKSIGRVTDLKLEDRYEVAEQAKEKIEQVSRQKLKDKRLRIRTFESEIDPLEFSLLDSGHFVLFRRVWNSGDRYVQGLLFDQQSFVDDLVASAFRESSLVAVSDLILAHQGNVVKLIAASRARDYSSSTPVEGSELLYQTRLVAPFSDMELIFSLARLPLSAGGQIILWSAFILALVLIGGVFMLYRLGAGQISLARQQQDFVSAVSHELKTPLTSIRMYGEMLREGWADEERKKSYYDFIFHESERLSRLINNVLHLARMTRNEQKPNLEVVGIEELLNELRPKLDSQLENAGFKLMLDADEMTLTKQLHIDPDWLTQVLINLVDNAIKFSANADEKTVKIGFHQQQDGSIQISVRDFGPGIVRDQMKKIFKLFYRSENELTRETVGTGIGLALVHQLVTGMGGEVDVVNCEPGVEFRIGFVVVD
ncbi:MAG: HAMP domain-containing histidine kinase [Gammaproteobacteria bacterium]|nr:HAMP domain-containing histidine kinase [Gammaproteobacteria bacterium]